MTALTTPQNSIPVPVRQICQTREHMLRTAEHRMREFLSAERARYSEVDSRASVLIDALADLIAAGGKRIRPAFCVTGYLAVGGDPDADAVVSASVALELLHACALIHDDVMDAASWRRGAPTVHTRYSAEHSSRRWRGEARRFGESVAILAGDLALVYSDHFMADVPSSINLIWNELRSELIIVQYMDISAAAEFSTDPELSRWIAVAKSGHYTIHRPLIVGATIAGRPEFSPTFEAYGVTLGEAFQLRDDLMDAFSDADVTGKPSGLDFEQYKMNLLLTLAIQRDTRLREMISGEVRDVGTLRHLLIETGIRAEVEEHIDRLVAQGCEAIAESPLEQVWQDELIAMAHEVAYRNK